MSIQANERPWAVDIHAPNTNQLFDPTLLYYYKEQGVRGLALDARYIMHNDTQDIDLRRLREQVGNFGLTLVTSHPFFGSWNNAFSTASQNKPRVTYELAWMREFIRRMGLLGMHAFPLHTGGALLPGASRWEIDLVIRYIEELLPAAAEANVIIAIENTNHAWPETWQSGDGSFTVTDDASWRHDDPALDLQVVEHFNSPWVGICYDIGHAHLLGKALETLEVFLPHIALYHIHDNGGDWHDSHLQPGYGSTPWFEVFRKMMVGKPDAPWYIEARPHHGSLQLMMEELTALCNGEVRRDERGFYVKNRLTGKLILSGDDSSSIDNLRVDPKPNQDEYIYLSMANQAQEGMSEGSYRSLMTRFLGYTKAHQLSPTQILLLNDRQDSPFILAALVEALGLGGLALHLKHEDERSRNKEAAIHLHPMIKAYIEDDDRLWFKQRPVAEPDDSKRYLGLPLDELRADALKLAEQDMRCSGRYYEFPHGERRSHGRSVPGEVFMD